MGGGLQVGSPWAIPLVFLIGIVTSAGPCAASRFVAVGAYAARSSRPFVIACVFVAGLVAAHVPIGVLAWTLRDVFLSIGRYTTFVNLAMAALLVGSGLVAIVRARAHVEHDHDHAGDDAKRLEPGSLMAVFALGVAFAVALGPCCAPPIMAIVFATTFVGKPLLGTLLLCVFAAGHAVPIFFLGPVTKAIGSIGKRFALEQVVAVVSGAFMIFLGGVYALCV
jgi:cytochrome c biogenesis protein CcdA